MAGVVVCGDAVGVVSRVGAAECRSCADRARAGQVCTGRSDPVPAQGRLPGHQDFADRRVLRRDGAAGGPHHPRGAAAQRQGGHRQAADRRKRDRRPVLVGERRAGDGQRRRKDRPQRRAQPHRRTGRGQRRRPARQMAHPSLRRHLHADVRRPAGRRPLRPYHRGRLGREPGNGAGKDGCLRRPTPGGVVGAGAQRAFHD